MRQITCAHLPGQLHPILSKLLQRSTVAQLAQLADVVDDLQSFDKLHVDDCVPWSVLTAFDHDSVGVVLEFGGELRRLALEKTPQFPIPLPHGRVGILEEAANRSLSSGSQVVLVDHGEISAPILWLRILLHGVIRIDHPGLSLSAL